jgi:hypothetical protein
MPDNTETFAQHRRWLKTRFAFGRKRLDYSMTSKRDASLREQVGYDAIASRSSWITMVEPDRDLRWALFVFSGLALLAAFRANAHPALLLGLYAGVTLLAVLVLVATRGLRSVGYTAIPAGTFNILVLHDKQHDAIVGRLETRRADMLTRDLASTDGVTLRTYLRRLRWLVENGAMTRDAFMQRQAALLPQERRSFLTDEPAAGFAHIAFTQRRFGTRIDVSLEANHFTYSRRTLLNASERFNVEYRNLREAALHEETDRQFEFATVLLLWAGTIVVVWGGFIQQSHPAGYYVGGIGLQRALVDFGPLLLFAVGTAAIVPWLTQIRIGWPWPGVALIRDAQYDAIVAAIADRRLVALRALARPDPLLHPEEQVQLLDELHDAGVIDGEEHARAVELAELAFGDPVLDEPIPADAAASRERILH